MEFNIGDRVKIKSWDRIPDELKNREDELGWRKARAKCCDAVGTITDKMYSEAFGKYVYRFSDEYGNLSKVLFDQSCFEKFDSVMYDIRVTKSDNRVFVKLVEIDPFGIEKEIINSFAYIFGEGPVNYAQAISFATNRIYKELSEE